MIHSFKKMFRKGTERGGENLNRIVMDRNGTVGRDCFDNAGQFLLLQRSLKCPHQSVNVWADGLAK